MSVSNLSFSANLPPFDNTNGYTNSFSKTNLSVSGDLSLATSTNSQTGQTTTNVNSSITANGINYLENAASFNGSLLMVNYLSSNAADSAQNSGTAQALLNTGISGNGVSFTPTSTTSQGHTAQTSYSTSPNTNFNLAIPGAAYSKKTGDDDQLIQLKSVAVVGNSLVATYQVTNGLPDNTASTPDVTPASQTTVTATNPSSDNFSGQVSFSRSGYSSIGDLLAADNGINTNGTVGQALQQSQGQSFNTGSSTAILAATLNPGINLSPSQPVQVTDFVNAGLNAFPAQASADLDDNSNGGDQGNNSTSNNSTPDVSNTDNSGHSSSSTDTGTAPASTPDSSSPIGIYNAVSNANASTIRGTGVNTVA